MHEDVFLRISRCAVPHCLRVSELHVQQLHNPRINPQSSGQEEFSGAGDFCI